ncbi:MFS transporter [Ktedonobacteria bacterium brp13]|nr:MFS transporter [Ktedonobacteria bacterium brp13]
MNQLQPSQQEPAKGRPPRPSRSLWRKRDFLLLWNGQNVSTLGTNLSTFALPLLVLALTHSPVQAGLLTAVRQLPYLLFSLPAGALIDRWNRKVVMIYCDLIRWLALGSVPLAFVLGDLTLLQLYSVAFLEGTGYVFFSLAQISALPQVASPEQLPQAYTLNTTTEYIGTLLGPTLGGFIVGLAPVVALGAGLAYLADCISYLVSLLSLLFIRTSFQMERTTPLPEKVALHKEIAEGLRFLWQQPLLRIMVVLTMAVNFLLSPVTLLIIVLAQRTLHIHVQTLGIILGAGGVGGVLGGIIAPWIRTRVRFGYVCIGSVFVWGGATLITALTSSPVFLAIGVGLSSLLWPIYGVILVTYRLSLTPDHLQGRVNSAFRFLSFGSEPLGAALGGFMVLPLGPRNVLILIAVGLVLGSIIAGCTPLRKA